MIPATWSPDTDAATIRCDNCRRYSHIGSAAKTTDEIRAVAAKSGWSTTDDMPRRKPADLCPRCTRERSTDVPDPAR